MTCDLNNIKFRFAIDRGGTFTDIYCKSIYNNLMG